MLEIILCVYFCNDECDVVCGTLDIQPNVQPIRAVECMDSFYTSLIALVWYQ